ncbi:MAG: type II secretion system protein N [Proteobacteria bacterium]|nr:type II secretion system protein N [Pseudomonadota bacterium]MBU1709086.1 type II secretion system protein N [Pseudomonadota bacterium]
MPADFAYGLLQKKIPQIARIKVYGVDGPWHNGKARGVAVDTVEATNVSWRLQPVSLITGRAVVDLHFQLVDSDFDCRIRARRGKLDLDDLQAQFPATLLTKVLPDMYAVPLGGLIRVAVNKVKIRDGLVALAEGRIVWTGAETTSEPQVRFGDLTVDIATSEQGVTAILTDSGGPLAAEGALIVSPDGKYSFTGNFSVRDKEQTALVDALSLLGRPAADGSMGVNFSGEVGRVLF